MIIRTPQAKIDEYYQRTSLNQSSIKVIMEGGMQSYLEAQSMLIAQEDSDLYYEEKEHFVIGKAVDCYITQGEDCYLKSYHFSNIKKPGESIMSIVKHVFDTVRGTTRCTKLADLQDIIYASCNHNKYYMNRFKPSDKDIENNKKLQRGEKVKNVTKLITWQDDNRWIDVVDKGEDYFRELIEAGDKQVLGDEQNILVNRIIDNLTGHPFTAWLFKDTLDVDTIYQCPIYFNLEGVFCKALLDGVRIHHPTKTITGFDVKTIGDHILRFNKAIRKRRYDVQASWYTKALECGIETLEQILNKSLEGYKIGKFAFVAESTKNPVCPMIFRMDNELLDVAEYGTPINQIDYMPGWRKALGDFMRWSDEGFDIDTIAESVKGIVEVNKKFEYTKLL